MPLVHPYLNSRRQILQGSLFAVAAATVGGLTGCQVNRPTGRLPSNVWPDGAPPAGDKPLAVHPELPMTPLPPIVGGLPTGVVPRSAWTSAKPSFANSKPMNGVTRITVHHSAINSTNLLAKADVARQLESIRQNHTGRTDPDTLKHWVDIGYHYIIDPQGRVWEGRPVTIEGAHVSHTNQHNLGVMCMGNFDEQRPTTAQLDALDTFVAGQMRRFRVPVSAVFTHQELRSTECPGRNLQRYMIATRSSSGRMALA